ncbi:Uma2 family endonuclease [Argonema antarcticum]|uniref:Uma2 family endonuclease n=1 Tax=Argonema antarcticum TaxID=2942763 RepID=UPI002012BED7|nr:Uma2 family endonuclease [Argonema antarcticum]MCL1472135.1 Uma2 family endonuclease [Argonema antarcticum A004/B2]
MSVNPTELNITWEKLPDNFVLDDEPVDNINQPVLASALTEALELSGKLQESMLVGTNFGICATVEGKTVVKAPDWFYVSNVLPTTPPNQNRRSYTPNLEGEVPGAVMEFLSETEGGEYSIKSKYPPGKWYYYERILQVPNYFIFEPNAGWLELYQLNASGRYQVAPADANNRYWIPQIGLFLGVWQGTKANRTGFWLRWWDETGQMLLWGTELVERERQRAERLAAQLRSAGIEPAV